MNLENVNIGERLPIAGVFVFALGSVHSLRHMFAVWAEHDTWLFWLLAGAIEAAGGLSRNGVALMLRRRARRAGVEGRVNPHSFRHAFAREFLMDGGDLATLADLMGHSSVEVTKASYALFTIQELQEKHRRHSPVARLLGGENGS